MTFPCKINVNTKVSLHGTHFRLLIPPILLPLVAGIDVKPDTATVVPLTEAPPPSVTVPAAFVSLDVDADPWITATVAGRSPYLDLDAVFG